MLEAIIEDKVATVHTPNSTVFRDDVNFADLVTKRGEVVEKWKALTPEKRDAYRSQADFESENGAPNLKDPSLLPARNFDLLLNEIKGRAGTHNLLQLLPLDLLDFDESVVELAESLENVPDIRELYRLRKCTTGNTKNAGINTDEAARLKNCFSQGRELYLAGRQGSLMVKPLNFFYALTAYAYGAIVLNNPIRFGKSNIPSSHGMTYLSDTIQAQFGGDSARGTFSDLVTAFPTQLIKNQILEFNVDCSGSLLEYYQRRFSVSLGTLLSMVPEMADYYKLTTRKSSRCHRIEVTNANDPRSLTWDFHIGDGETRPSQQGIEQAFEGFSRSERFGKTVITVPAARASQMKACIYTDVRGDLWFVDNPFFPVILPEIALHFLVTSMFSNIMRYRPDEWGSVLVNDVSSSISLLTRHYFSSFQRKFFIVVLRAVSRYIPYAG